EDVVVRRPVDLVEGDIGGEVDLERPRGLLVDPAAEGERSDDAGAAWPHRPALVVEMTADGPGPAERPADQRGHAGEAAIHDGLPRDGAPRSGAGQRAAGGDRKIAARVRERERAARIADAERPGRCDGESRCRRDVLRRRRYPGADRDRALARRDADRLRAG